MPRILSPYKKMPTYAKRDKDSRYAESAWIELSKNKRASGRCIMCPKRIHQPASLVVDHIVPIVEGGSFYDERNHQVLCVWHHNSKSGKEKRGSKTPWMLNEINEKIPSIIKTIA